METGTVIVIHPLTPEQVAGLQIETRPLAHMKVIP